MKALTVSLQRLIFTFILYLSSVSGLIGDLTSEGSRTLYYAAYDGLIIFLALLSFTYVKRGLAIILIFMTASIIFNFTYTEATFYASLNGTREIVMIMALPIFYSQIFADGNEEEAQKYVNILRKFSWFFLLINVPAAVAQWSKYGPSDYVGGTYGSFNGGGLTIVIICLVFFMFQFQMAIWKQILLYLLLVPLLLNETKVSFILIPMMVVFIYFEPKVKNILLAIGGAVFFIFIFNMFYTHENWDLDNNVAEIFSWDFLQDYLLEDYEKHNDVPRLTKIILGYGLISHETQTFLFGMEYGLFRGTTSGEQSLFAQNWEWLLDGSRPYTFFLLMQGGMTLVTGFFAMIFQINNFFRKANKFAVFYFLILMIIMVYQDTFRLHHFSLVFFFLIFYANSSLYKNKSIRYEDSYSVH